jgi:hypothetical protein
MKKIIITVFSLLTINSFTQCYKLVQNEVTAKYRIYITKNKSEANILGYQVSSYVEVLKPGLIYFAPIYFNKATPVYKVNSVDKADLIIFWVSKKEDAQWIK